MVDEIWKDRPPVNALPVFMQPVEYAGCSVTEKLKELREKLQHEKARGIIIAALDEVLLDLFISWFLIHYNIFNFDFLRILSTLPVLIVVLLLFLFRLRGCTTLEEMMCTTAQWSILILL